MKAVIRKIYRYHKINSEDKIILWLSKSGITMMIHNKDDIEFDTEFPCLLGHPVDSLPGSLCSGNVHFT